MLYPVGLCGREGAAGTIGEFRDERLDRQRIVRAAAERGADPFRDHLAVFKGDPHLGAEMLAAVASHLRMGRGMDAAHQRADLGVAERLPLEILEADAAL